jgi:hypothetical protein
MKQHYAGLVPPEELQEYLPALRELEELAARILNPEVVDKESIHAQLFHPSPLVWSVSLTYVGCSRIRSHYRTVKRRGKAPTQALKTIKNLLETIIRSRKEQQP